MYQKYILFSGGVPTNRTSICGMVRIFDFDNMLQINEYNDNARHIKRVEKKDIYKFMETELVKGLSGYCGKSFDRKK